MLERRKYVGPHDGVSVEVPGRLPVETDEDGIVEVPAEVAALLDEQPDNWQKAGASSVSRSPVVRQPQAPALRDNPADSDEESEDAEEN
jgi:hypothetical protein